MSKKIVKLKVVNNKCIIGPGLHFKKILKFQKHNHSYFITREGAHVVVGSVKPLSDNFLASYETADHRGYQPKLSIKDMKKPLIRS